MSQQKKNKKRRPSKDTTKGNSEGFTKNKERSKTNSSKRDGRWNKQGKVERSVQTRPNERLSTSIAEKAQTLTLAQLKNWREQSKEAENKQYTSELDANCLDPWQDDAVQSLFGGANVIVDAPTTAGKTRIVEAYFDMHLNDAGFRACYTCPVKSLSNDKLREFREKYGKESVGIATGDIKENLDAPLVVATLESYRNSLLGVEPDLKRSLVIFDEYHFLQDESRGSAWEEAIILTPKNCQLLLLSASLSNANEFADWIEDLSKRPSVLIEVSKRPVPLANMVWHQGEWFLKDCLPHNFSGDRKSNYCEPLPHSEVIPRLLQLLPLGLTPCIVYAGKRLSCELLALELAKTIDPLEQEKSREIGEFLLNADREYNALSFIKPHLRKMIQVYGVAFHHSGLAPMARLLIESLVKAGLMRFCSATMGLSLGINFSVKSTVISDSVRPGESGFTPYSPSEVLQMTGRAGRRGKDLVGFSCWLNKQYLNRFSTTVRDRCDSRLRNDPITFLGLLSRGFSLAKIEQFYLKSFQNFRQKGNNVRIIRPERIRKKLHVDSLPCSSPLHEFAAYHSEVNSLCYDCPHIKACHGHIEEETSGVNLASLHLHLHEIGALNNLGNLSPVGELARYFPQSGGFVIANMILNEEIRPDNMIESAQLFGALSLARFKTPQVPGFYRLPFDRKKIEKEIETLYPAPLFPELYETPRGHGRNAPVVVREFNPAAGYIVDLWTQGCEWNELLERCSSKQFGAGDITGLLYRSASYLQSLAQCPNQDLANSARDLREEILRAPLQVVL